MIGCPCTLVRQMSLVNDRRTMFIPQNRFKLLGNSGILSHLSRYGCLLGSFRRLSPECEEGPGQVGLRVSAWQYHFDNSNRILKEFFCSKIILTSNHSFDHGLGPDDLPSEWHA